MSILLSTKRRIVQLVSLVALNTNIWSLGERGLCLPVMNCEACAVAWLGCPIGMMARSIAFIEFPLVAFICVIGVGLLVGRFFCGWVCPMGLLFDMLYKIRVPKIRIPAFFGWFKYAFLVLSVFVVAYVFGENYEFTKLFFCNFCPTAALDVVIPEMIMNQDFYMNSARIFRFSILAIVIVMAIVNHRSFCKVMCPIGAMIAVTNKFSLFSINLDKHKCIECGKCNDACPMDGAIMETKETSKGVNRNLECIDCLNCEQSCPVKAISNNSRILHKND
jgi:ferredoxin-type protein NapH